MLLTDWAKREGIGFQKAKDWARRGKLKGYAELREFPVKRWTIDDQLTKEACISIYETYSKV